MIRRIDVGRWYHGDSNTVECTDGCGQLMTNATDRLALATAKHHANRTGHIVTIEQCRFRNVVPE